MTTDDMKRELEANGWSVRHMVDGDNSPYEYWTITTPDGWEWETDARQHRGSWLTFEHSPELESEAVTKAYAHLQEQKLLQYCVLYIESPREIEMMQASIPVDDREWFVDEIEKRCQGLHGKPDESDGEL